MSKMIVSHIIALAREPQVYKEKLSLFMKYHITGGMDRKGGGHNDT